MAATGTTMVLVWSVAVMGGTAPHPAATMIVGVVATISMIAMILGAVATRGAMAATATTAAGTALRPADTLIGATTEAEAGTGLLHADTMTGDTAQTETGTVTEATAVVAAVVAGVAAQVGEVGGLREEATTTVVVMVPPRVATTTEVMGPQGAQGATETLAVVIEAKGLAFWGAKRRLMVIGACLTCEGNIGEWRVGALGRWREEDDEGMF